MSVRRFENQLFMGHLNVHLFNFFIAGVFAYTSIVLIFMSALKKYLTNEDRYLIIVENATPYLKIEKFT